MMGRWVLTQTVVMIVVLLEFFGGRLIMQLPASATILGPIAGVTYVLAIAVALGAAGAVGLKLHRLPVLRSLLYCCILGASGAVLQTLLVYRVFSGGWPWHATAAEVLLDWLSYDIALSLLTIVGTGLVGLIGRARRRRMAS